jgi:hypothetical protein
MNEIYYKHFILPYIKLKNREALNKKFVGFKKTKLNLLLFLHAGTPCDQRYCICKHFDTDDIYQAFNS